MQNDARDVFTCDRLASRCKVSGSLICLIITILCLMVVIHIEKANVNSDSVFEGHRIRFIGHLDFHYLEISLTLVFSLRSAFFECLR